MPEKIRVGVLLDTLDVPAWQLAALESITRSDCAELTRVVLCGSSRATSNRFVTRCLCRVIRRLDTVQISPELDACRLVSAVELLRSVTSPEHSEIDVLLLFADPASATVSLPPARLGYWCFTNSGRPFAPANGTMVGVEELLRLEDSLETSLRVLDPESGRDRIVYSTRSGINYLSHSVTRNEHLWKCSTFIVRVLMAHPVAEGRENESTAPASVESQQSIVRELSVVPALLSYLIWRIWKKAYRRLFSERWVLMIALDECVIGEGTYKTLVPPRDRFWADPHVIEHDGRHHVFFEEASRDTGVGHISVMSDDGQGKFAAPQCVLQRPFHLSYPFVFRWEGSWYLLPESGENRNVQLYRSVRFPDMWEPDRVLLTDIEAFDSTLVEHGGRWWLFSNVRARSETSTWDELHVFHSDSPVSDAWQPHRANPVVSDVCRARPAGRFFLHDGHLYRPSQNSSRRYGRALMINKVVELSESRYVERTIREIESCGHNAVSAIHSYSRAGRLTLIDAIQREVRTDGLLNQ